MRDDLIGPAAGAQEELRDAPVDRYLLGLLAPRRLPFGSASASADEDEAGAAFDVLPEDDLAAAGAPEDSGEEGAADDRPPAVDQLVPSAFGMTFALDASCDTLEVSAHWGAYARHASEEKLDHEGKPARVWRRRPCGGSQTIAVNGPGPVKEFMPDPAEPEVTVRGLVRERDGHRLVSLFLVNGQTTDQGRAVARWLCQAQLSASHPDGKPVFVRRELDAVGLAPAVDREELAGLEMQYRDTVELAVGHGVAVDATPAPGKPGRAIGITTTVMPAAEVPRTEAPGPEDFADDAVRDPFVIALDALDMQTLSEAADAKLPGLLTPLVDAYDAWIAQQRGRIADPGSRLDGHEKYAEEHLDTAATISIRIRAGIDALVAPDVAEAFRFANHAMWQQRIHTIAGELRRKDPALKLHQAVELADEPENRSWRPFQLAFILLNLPALADPLHAERGGAGGLVDLLFFPTGGGKTEAYLGLTAFAIAIRRLQGVVAGRDGRDGVAVLMRYTLRLLTLQQFQRAAALLCACELRRRALYGNGVTAEQRRWGTTPMRIGLWVGQASTPNSTDEATAWLRQAKDRKSTRGSSPAQLARCAWCGDELTPARSITVDGPRGRTLLSCTDTTGECPFTLRNSPGEGLPVVVVDEEVYRLLPALVIATVDKLARMPWEGRVQALFGQVQRRCERHGYLTASEGDHPNSHPKRGADPAAVVLPAEPLRPPDLVIQDELHLISGPLGSLVGLYETAVDELATWEIDGVRVRPKVVASTATIRRAQNQVRRLFDRQLAIFPPPGLDARDAFFALQRDAPGDADKRPGRRYLGVCAPGRRYKQVLIRVYVAQLKAAWTVLDRQPGEAADAYMTLVGYFNSLRELGGMRRLVEDDVQSRLFRADGTNRGRLQIEELTSRKTASDIPETLDRLGIPRLSTEKRKPRKDGKAETPSIDVLLATNMISVGVDVQRLGAMVVAGQPKSTSEYIQATSRVGRRFPGLVVTVYNWARPRDLSHYETFGHYHRTLYRQVEALSITPFAERARDRGLTGVVTSLMRLSGSQLNPNAGAAFVDAADERARRTIKAIHDRADDELGPNGADELAEEVAKRIQEWESMAKVGQRNLVYRRIGKQEASTPLLEEPRMEGWTRWTVPTSMRNVEAPVPLALREHGIVAAPEGWEAPEKPAPAPPKDDA